MLTDSLHTGFFRTSGKKRGFSFILRKGEREVIRKRDKAVKVRCISGLLWVTQEKDIRDIILKPGEEFIVTHRGKALVSSLADSECSSSLI
ncbi:MAG TPA: DUF2917 domain-containing protein [Spirochaetota bacterium]|nr:DUF2917 domain-containing protein [Spirochaetota bacterium]HPJ34656.1 DUF2917 domain-containing protein [Spirochaetota bacterium]